MQHIHTVNQHRGHGWKAVLATPGAWLIMAWSLLCLPWLSGIKTLPFDTVQQFFPAVSFSAEQLRHWQAPWWNPWLYAGYPQLADPQMMTFQPTMVLPMLLGPASLHWFNVVVLLHLLGGGFGALRLARHYRLHVAPQLLFALMWMFGSVAASRLQHTPMIVSFSLLPWLWLGVSRLRHDGRARDVWLAGITGGLCALQLTQVTYFIIVGCAVYGSLALIRAPSGRRVRLVAGFAAVAALAALISAPQWLSTLAYLPQTNRATISLQEALAGSIGWPVLSTLLSGNFLSQGRGDYWGWGDISQDYLYLGAVPLALWLCWGRVVVTLQPVRSRLALALIVLAAAFALGGRTPLFAWLFHALPGLDLFRRPADALFVLIPPAAWLSAHAAQAALDGKAVRPHWPSVVVVLSVLGYSLWLALAHTWHPLAVVWLLLSAAIGAGALYVVRRTAWPAPRAGRMLIVLTVIDLLIFNVGTAFNATSASKSVPTARRDGPTQSAWQLLHAAPADGIPDRAAVFGIGSLTNGAAAYRLPLVNGYNPWVSADYLAFVGMPAYPLDNVQDKLPTAWAPDLDAPVYDLLGLRWVVAQQAFPGSQAYDAFIQVSRRETVLPRVLNPRTVQRHALRFPPAPAFSATDFEQVVWLPATASAPCPDVGGGVVQLGEITYQASHLSVRYRADAAAWLVVNELAAPGWEARAGGTNLPIERANGVFRAVCVPQGEGVVVFNYRPWVLWRDAVRPRGG